MAIGRFVHRVSHSLVILHQAIFQRLQVPMTPHFTFWRGGVCCLDILCAVYPRWHCSSDPCRLQRPLTLADVNKGT